MSLFTNKVAYLTHCLKRQNQVNVTLIRQDVVKFFVKVQYCP